MKISSIEAGDAVTVCFPLPAKEETVHIAGLGRTKTWDQVSSAWEFLEDSYRVRWRGNAVVGIDPIGNVRRRSTGDRAEQLWTCWQRREPFTVRSGRSTGRAAGPDQVIWPARARAAPVHRVGLSHK